MRLLGASALAVLMVGLTLASAQTGKQADAPVAKSDTPASAKLEASPATLKLAPEEGGTAIVVARNTGTTPLKKAVLILISTTGLKFKADAAPRDIPVGGSAAWVVTVERPIDAPEGGEVTARLEYTSGDDKTPVGGVVTAKIDVPSRTRPSLDKMLETRVESSLKQLQEQRPGIIYLTVKNKADFPVKVTVEHLAPADKKPQFEVTLPDPHKDVDLVASGEHAFPITLTAGNTVRPGKEVAAFVVTANWTEAGRSRTASSVTKHEFDLGVLGESELLTVIGAPSLLVLPGVLLLFTFQMCWNNLSGRTPFTLGIKDATFWVLAVLFSIAAVGAYPLLTRLVLKQERDLLSGYGLMDIAFVWVGSILVAVLAWLLVATSLWAKQQVHQWLKDRAAFREGDPPAMVLTKLSRNDRGLLLEQVNFGAQNPVRALLLWEDSTEAWITPPLLFDWTTQADLELRSRFDQATRVEGPHGAKTLAKLIEGAATNGLRLRWQPTGSLTAPRRVQRSELTPVGQKQWLVNPSE